MTLSLQGDGDDEENVPEEDEVVGMFSRRKLKSNWDRYEDSEKVECEDDMPTCRGTDFDVLLAAAGKIQLSLVWPCLAQCSDAKYHSHFNLFFFFLMF